MSDTTYPYDGLLLKQRATPHSPLVFVLCANARSILKWSSVQRTIEKKGAAQRPFSKSHADKIRNYLGASPDNIIPTAVTIALSKSSYVLDAAKLDKTSKSAFCAGTLTVTVGKDEKLPGLIIDGQHRLLAAEEYDEDVMFAVSVILGPDPIDRAVHFVVINNKAKRVPTDLVKAIVADLKSEDREVFFARLTGIGLTVGSFPEAVKTLFVHSESPFRGLVDWDLNHKVAKRKLKPAAIEAALRIISSDLVTSSSIDVDDAVDILSAMWHGVIDAWEDEKKWYRTKLASKAGFVAFTEFIVKRLNVMSEDGTEVDDPEFVRAEAKGIASSVPAKFWLAEWKLKGLDTSTGRGIIEKNLGLARNIAARGQNIDTIELLSGDDEDDE